MNNIGAKRCGTCKHFAPGQPYPECHRWPIQTQALLIGVGPPTQQAPNGTPIIHLDVRYPVTQAQTPSCGEWSIRIEVAHDIGEVQVMRIPGNGGDH